MAKLTQKQVEDWIAQNGGATGLQYGVEQKSIRNPTTDSFELAQQPYVNIEVEVWRNPKTGASLTVRRDETGDFEQIENVGPKPEASTVDGPPGGKPYIDEPGPNGRRLGWNPATKQYDRDLGPSAEAQQPPKPTTETVRTPVQGKPGVYQVTTKDSVTGQTETHFEDEQGNRVQTPTADAQETRQPVTRNGKTYIQVTVKNPDGTSSLRYEDQQGNPVTLPDEEKPGSYQPLPNGVPKFIPDLTSLDLGLGERRRALDALVNSGVITREQAAATITADAESAVAAGRNAGSIVNIQEGNRSAALSARGQDITDASSRRQFASSTFNQALSTMGPAGSAFIPGAGSAEAAAAGLLATLGLARQHAAASGGMNPLPAYDPSQYPALQQYGGMGIPGAGGTKLSDHFTQPSQGATPAGAGAVLQQAAAAAEEAQRQQQIRANPIFRPQPPVAMQQPVAPTISINVGGGQPSQAAAQVAPPPVTPGPAAQLFSRLGPASLGAAYDPHADGLADDFAAAGFDPGVIGSVFGQRRGGGLV